MKRISCNVCKFPAQNCLCAALPHQSVDNRWPVYILQHKLERTHALNTARIAVLGLKFCQLYNVTDGPVEQQLPTALLVELGNALLIYPGAASTDVVELHSRDMTTRPLLLLDASWRKSRRMLLGSPWLQTLPRISFDLAQPSRYRLRREPAPSYCSSLEALCAVLGKLEGDQQKYTPLLGAMDVMVSRQVEQMGEATFRRNYVCSQDDR